MPEDTGTQDQAAEQAELDDLQDQAKPWNEALPEDLKKDPNLTTFKSLEDFAKSHVSLRKRLGQAITIPDDKADEATWGEFYKKLGRPEKPEEYPNLEAPEGVEVNEKLVEAFKKAAHESGLNKTQARKVLQQMNGVFMEEAKASQEAEEASRKAAEETLKKEFGTAYDQRLSLAKRTFKQFADKDTLAFIESSGLGNHPGFVRLFAGVGMKVLDDVSIDGTHGKEGLGITPQEALDKIRDIRFNTGGMKHKAYMDSNHPAHRAVTEELNRLYEFATAAE